MKHVMKYLGVFCLSLLVFTACSRSDDPTDNNLFVGVYKKSISYVDKTRSISTKDGSVTVVKTGNSYYFRFSDGIPELKGIQFKKEEDDKLVNADFKDGIQYVRISAQSLSILYTQDVSKIWTVNASR